MSQFKTYNCCGAVHASHLPHCCMVDVRSSNHADNKKGQSEKHLLERLAFHVALYKDMEKMNHPALERQEELLDSILDDLLVLRGEL